MSPFDGKSCIAFYTRIARNRQEWSELRKELQRHAEACSCPCPPCVRLRRLGNKERSGD